MKRSKEQSSAPHQKNAPSPTPQKARRWAEPTERSRIESPAAPGTKCALESRLNVEAHQVRSRTRLREIIPGALYLITRKTNDDLFYLRPGEGIEEVLLYLLLLKAKRYRLKIHGFIVMSNHVHLVVSDPIGQLPAFAREFFSESSKAVQDVLGIKCQIWASKRYAATELLDHDAAQRAIAYCHTNPTEAGLTLPQDWPGLSSAHHPFGERLEAQRPEGYFGSYRPEIVEAVLEPLPRVVGETREEETSEPGVPDATRFERCCQRLQNTVDRLVRESVERIQQRREQNSEDELLGKEEVLKTSRLRRGNRPDTGITPRFMSKDPKRRKRAIDRRKCFLSEHVIAKERYIGGEQQVWFPRGTYGYRELLEVKVRGGGVAV